MSSIAFITKTVFKTSPGRLAAVSARMSSNCIFCKIVAKETPSNILHEVVIVIVDTHVTLVLQDDKLLVFPDISPAGKHHLLVIPKVTSLSSTFLLFYPGAHS